MTDFDPETLTEDQLANIRDMFEDCDEDGNGVIDIGELEQALLSMGHETDPDSLQAIMDSLDVNKLGVISWQEFLMGLGPILIAQEAAEEEDALTPRSSLAVDSYRTRVSENLENIDVSVMYSQPQLETLHAVYSLIDTDNSGAVSRSELVVLFEKLSIAINADLESLFPEDDDEINFNTFVLVVGTDLVGQGELTGEMLGFGDDPLSDAELEEVKRAFELADEDNNGVVDADELATVFRHLGRDVSATKLAVILHRVDTNGDGVIQFDEFVTGLGKIAVESHNEHAYDPENEATMLLTRNRVRELRLDIARDVLGDDQLSVAAEVFNGYCHPESPGELPLSELKAVLQELGQSPSYNEIRDLYEKLDTTSSGGCRFDAFAIELAKRANPNALKNEASSSSLRPSAGSKIDLTADMTPEQLIETIQLLIGERDDFMREAEAARKQIGALEDAAKAQQTSYNKLQEDMYDQKRTIGDLRKELGTVLKLQRDKAELLDEVAKMQEAVEAATEREERYVREINELTTYKKEHISTVANLQDELVVAHEKIVQYVEKEEGKTPDGEGVVGGFTDAELEAEVAAYEEEIERLTNEVVEWKEKCESALRQLADFKLNSPNGSRRADALRQRTRTSSRVVSAKDLASELSNAGFKVKDATAEQIADLSDALEGLEGEHAKLRAKYDSLKTTHADLVKETNEAADAAVEVERNLRKLEKAHTVCEPHLTAATTERDELREETAQLREALEKLQDKYASEKARRKDAEAGLADAGVTIEELMAKIDSLKGKRAGDKERMRELTEELEGLDAKVLKYKDKYAVVKEEAAAAADSAAKYKEKYSNAKVTIADLEAEIERLKGLLATANEEAAAADASIQKAKDAKRELKAGNAELVSEIEELKAKLAAAEASGSVANEKAESAAADVASLTETVAKLEGKLEKKSAALDESNAEVERLQGKVEKAKAKAGSAAESAGELETALQTANEELASMTAERDGLQESVEKLEGKVAKYKDKAGELEAQLASTTESLAAATSAKEALAEEIEKLEGKVAKYKDKAGELEAQLASVNESHGSVTSEKDTLQAQVEKLEGKVAKYKDRASELETELASTAESLTAATSENEALTGKVGKLEGKVAGYKEEISELESRADGAEADKAGVAEDYTELKTKYERRKEELATANERIAELESELAAAVEERTAIKTKAAEYKVELAAAQEQAAETETKLADTQAKLTEATTTVAKVTSELEEKTESMRSEIATLTAAKEESETRVATLSASVSELEVKVEETESRAEAAEKAHAAAGGDAAELATRVAQLETEVKQEQTAKTQAEEKAKELACEVTTLEEKVTDATTEVKTLQAEKEELVEKVAAAEEKANEVAAARDAVEAQVAELKTTLATLEEKVEESEAKATGSTEAVTKLETAYEVASKEVVQLSEEVVVLKATVVEKEAIIAEVVAKTGDAEKEVNNKVTELESKLASVESTLTETETTLTQQKERVSEVEGLLESAQSELGSEREALAALRQQLDTSESEKADLQAEIERLRALLDDERAGRAGLEEEYAAALAQPSMQIVVDETDGPLDPADESVIAFVSDAMAGDTDLAARLPIKPRMSGVRKATVDGVMLCKLVNWAVPGTIDERVIRIRVECDQDILDNMELGLNSAKAIGCSLLDVSTESLACGIVPHILSYIWEVVRVHVLACVTPLIHPELLQLRESGEDNKAIFRMRPEQLLLRWVNYQLKQARSAGLPTHPTVNDFGPSLSDGSVLATLTAHLSGSGVSEAGESVDTRVAYVVATAQSLGCGSFASADAIVGAESRLNIMFLSTLLNTNPGMEVTEREEAAVADLSRLLNVEGTREQRVFKLWMASLGIEREVDDLETDLRDGVAILQTLDAVAPGCVDWSKVVTNPKKVNRFTSVANANYVCGVCAELGFSLVNIQGADIVDGNLKLTLALLWQAMRFHILAIIRGLSLDGREVNEEDVVEWANSKVREAGKSTKMKSFQDKSLGTGVFLIDLLASLSERAVDYSVVTPGATEEEKELNAKYAIGVARKLGACVFLVWEDVAEVNPKMLLTFVGTLMSTFQGAAVVSAPPSGRLTPTAALSRSVERRNSISAAISSPLRQ